MENTDVLSEPQENRPNIKAIFVVILALGILASAVTYVFRSNTNKEAQNVTTQSITDQTPGISSNTLVYGEWSGNNALVQAHDFATGSEYTLALLKQNVKHIRVLDDDHVIYISGTDQYDHGNGIAVYTISEDTEKVVYKATQGMGIDDYRLSPNGQYIATWEVTNGPDGQLSDGKSAVYTDRVSGGQKNSIYDETQTNDNPVHYPVAITNSGDVYMDQFLPNVQVGWAEGMSVSDFSGTNKQDIASMQQGTYGTQPELSPDGRYLVFAGYDATHDPKAGDPIVRSLIRPNTIALFDTQSKSRSRLSNLPTNDIFSNVSWDPTTNTILFNAIGPGSDETKSGLFSYDLKTKESTKLNIGDNEYVATLSNGKDLVGDADESGTTIGNLGTSYAAPLLSLSVRDQAGNEQSIKTDGNQLQFIDLRHSNYFAIAKDVGTSVQSMGSQTKKKLPRVGSDCGGQDNLQMCPFFFKTVLAPKRSKQQSEPKVSVLGAATKAVTFKGHSVQGLPRCRDLAAQQCTEQGVRNASCGQHIWNVRQQGQCYDSPLYLYGSTGRTVHVTIGTTVFGAIPSYNKGYDVRLSDSGKMLINGNTFDSISYDYTPALKKLPELSSGVVVSQQGVPVALTDMAQELGLNEKETVDLVSYGEKQVISPYVFISYFDQATSEKILPLHFSPNPNSYLNVVFYFRLLSQKPPFSVPSLQFPDRLPRTGFTAVEVSGIVQ